MKKQHSARENSGTAIYHIRLTHHKIIVMILYHEWTIAYSTVRFNQSRTKKIDI
jgi:hypothetical protein